MKKHKLNISEKNFLHNILLTTLICGMIFSYMAFYMPNVYLEKKIEKAENDAVEVHKSFVKNKNYTNLDSLARQGMYSYFVENNTNKIVFSSMHLQANVTAKSDNLKKFLDYMQNDSFKEFDEDEFISYLKPIGKELEKEFYKFIDIESIDKIKTKEDNQTIVKQLDGLMFLKMESRTKDSVATNIVIVSKEDDGVYVSIYPYILNSINDIKSTIISAFPLIFLLIVLIVFWLNRIYSKSITEPIIKMSNFTKRSKNEKDAKYDLEINTNDEIEELSNDIKALYESLTKSYKDLERNSKKREIFVKATSHELKTPLQTAILLNDSMINKFGKYSDTDKYLPELREKLYKIQVLIDDLLFMNKIDESPIFEDIDLALVMKESIENHSNMILEKNLDVKVEGTKIDYTDYDHFRIIFDNLIKNAIENTDYNGNIICEFKEDIVIKNYPTYIDEKTLENITEPFVSSKKKSSSGIGLYIAKNLLMDMKYDLKIDYKENTFIVKIIKL